MTAGVPPMRHAATRQQEVLRLLREEGEVRAVELADRLGVTHETVRRDLLTLHRAGLLRRVHGGAVPLGSLALEPAISERTGQAGAKTQIAQAALQYLPDAGAILLDSGTSVARFAQHLPATASLTVLTGSLPIALSLVPYPGLSVHTLGGRVREVTLAEVDQWALDRLAQTHVDVAFLGANAVSIDGGLGTPDHAEAVVKAAMIDAADLRVLLVDATKWRRRSVFRYASLEAIDVLVTDARPSAAERRDLTAMGVQLHRVDVDASGVTEPGDAERA